MNTSKRSDQQKQNPKIDQQQTNQKAKGGVTKNTITPENKKHDDKSDSRKEHDDTGHKHEFKTPVVKSNPTDEHSETYNTEMDSTGKQKKSKTTKENKKH